MSLHTHYIIRPTHLARFFVVYIRQSSKKQVIFNTASTARQYDFRRRALEYGWPPEKIIIVDEDQGITGTAFGDRPGFRRIHEEIARGRIGAVGCVELARLSRDDLDFAQLVSICRWTDTLLVDEDDIYDPTTPNGQILLGIKGTMSAAEHHFIYARLIGSMRQKASTGDLRIPLPPGFIYEPFTQKVIFDPDREVQRVVRLFFELFKEIGTANGVYQEYKRLNQLFPKRSGRGLNGGKIVWRPMYLKLSMEILHNPSYAGAYAYGRKKTIPLRVPGELLKFNTRQVPVKRDEWRTLILDHHEGYINWDQYLLNERRLADNKSDRSGGVRGPLGPGSALLQGIAVCGHCGRQLQIKYPRGHYSLYHCLNKGCHTFTGESSAGVSVDKEVADALLQALEPAQLAMSINSLKQAEAEARESNRQWELILKRAQQEAERAEVEFHQADSKNRRVKRSLETRWEEKLAEIDRLKMEQLKRQEITPPAIDQINRRAVLELAQNVPEVWNAAKTTNIQRKTLLRFLIEEVTLSRRKSGTQIDIEWKTKRCTTLFVPLPKIKRDQVRTSSEVVDKIRGLAPDHSDRRIAEILNESELLPAKAKKFTLIAVRQIRFKNGIKTGCPDTPINRHMLQRGDGLFTTRGAAEKLNITAGTVLVWIRKKILKAFHLKEQCTWWIELTPETIEELRKPARQRHIKRIKAA